MLIFIGFALCHSAPFGWFTTAHLLAALPQSILQCEGHFVNKSPKMGNKLNLQLFQKNEKGKRQKKSKNEKMGGARPPIFYFLLFLSHFPFSIFGKVANFQKINFPFFFDFSFFYFLRNGPRIARMDGGASRARPPSVGVQTFLHI